MYYAWSVLIKNDVLMAIRRKTKIFKINYLTSHYYCCLGLMPYARVTNQHKP